MRCERLVERLDREAQAWDDGSLLAEAALAIEAADCEALQLIALTLAYFGGHPQVSAVGYRIPQSTWDDLTHRGSIFRSSNAASGESYMDITAAGIDRLISTIEKLVAGGSRGGAGTE